MDKGEEILLWACRQNDVRAVKTVLKTFSLDVNCYDEETEMTPLHIAICEKNFPIVRLLLSRGADVNLATRTFLHVTPLQFAVDRQNIDIVEILLQHKADLTQTNSKNETALYIVANFRRDKVRTEQRQRMIELILRHGQQNHGNYYKLCDLVFKNDLGGVQELMQNLQDVDFQDSNEESPIYWAVRENRLEITKLLLEKGARVDPFLKSTRSKPLLHVALSKGYLDLAALLLDHGTKIYHQEHDMFWLGIRRKYMESLFEQRIFSRIVENRDLKIDAADFCGSTILHWACHYGTLANVKTVMRYYPHLLNAKSNGNTALHYASEYDVTGETVEFLLNCAGIDIEANNFGGVSALFCACISARTEKALAAFLRHDKGLLTTKSENGWGLVHLAAVNGCSSRPLQFLLSLDELDASARDNAGCGPLHLYKELRYGVDEWSVISLQCRKIELLLIHGADANAKNLAGQTPRLTFECCGARAFYGVEHDCPVVGIFRKLWVLCKYRVNRKTLGNLGDCLYEELNETETKRYEDELEILKSWVINSNPKKTLYDVLLMKRREIAEYSSNRVLRKIYGSCERNFTTRFPHYGFWLNLQLTRGLKRKSLIDAARDVLNFLVGLEMPGRCSDDILQYFSDSFLKDLSAEKFNFY